MISPVIASPTLSPSVPSEPWAHLLDDWCGFVIRDAYRAYKRRLFDWAMRKRDRCVIIIISRINVPFKCVPMPNSEVIGTCPAAAEGEGRLSRVLHGRKVPAAEAKDRLTWDDKWDDGPTRTFVPTLWFFEQVWEDVVNKSEFVFRIRTRDGLSPMDEGFRGLVRIKEESIKDRYMILVIDDEPLISNGETPLVPE
ncbi:hypothetical protein E2C01_061310 [Portunus trituberculatus]|uniref:Uncharacterized protein n=1 Tax=Portunus trituberculatus TaxID=210409 RepID=A0A5B7HAD9_PORTR|nr:hypothetical protein [Portunus trituberculatus]